MNQRTLTCLVFYFFCINRTHRYHGMATFMHFLCIRCIDRLWRNTIKNDYGSGSKCCKNEKHYLNVSITVIIITLHSY